MVSKFLKDVGWFSLKCVYFVRVQYIVKKEPAAVVIGIKKDVWTWKKMAVLRRKQDGARLMFGDGVGFRLV